MSRSGYSDDCDDNWEWIRWRGYVASAIRGKRGQAFLKEMLAAMDAMPEKRLIAHELDCENGVCAIGTVGKSRGVDMSKIDPEDYSSVSGVFDINEKLVQEIVYMNDEAGIYKETDEDRFRRMRAWIVSNIKESEGSNGK